MSRVHLASKRTRKAARKALACIASAVLLVGLMPGLAQADGTHVIEGDLADPLYVPVADGIYHDVKVDGSIAVNGDAFNALHVNAVGEFGDYDEKAEVTGSVSMESGGGSFYAVAVDASTSSCNTAEVIVGEDVTATSTYGGDAGRVEGVHVQTGSSNGTGKAIITVNGEIHVSAEGSSGDGEADAYGVYAYNYGDQTSVYAGDTMVSNETTGKAVGVCIDSTKDSNTTTILVDGTVSAKSAESGKSVGIMQKGGAGNLDITVWKIAVGEGGYIASSEDDNVFVEDKDLETKIDYIIKLDQPTQGNILSLSGTTEKSIKIGDKSYSYSVANWTDGDGTKVYLKAAEGWVITGGYSDKEKSAPLLHDDGGWYVIVPNGGGVYLTAQVAVQQFDVVFKNGEEVLQSDKVEYGGMPEYRGETPTRPSTVAATYEFAGWEPVLDKVTGDITYEATFTEIPREYSVTFDLGGGTIDGESSYTMTALYGSTITLPTPVREGYEFLYWEGSRYDAGASYKVEGEHAFKAVWKKSEDGPVSPDNPTPKTPGKTLPATGDSAPIAPVAAMLLLSGAVLAIGRKRRA